ncbi:endonuclease/exonuclease/phosphatase family protein [Nonomuraea soli]|uniref:Endonuclease/exonuclease/phosphatase family metal-dependent hydrolase n=1 Tax=Nonomuraea soli TaxID=1032476 RepID=A0A7W0HU06_9ACTN|nr:endonuclease/exonuclease/phosphatase family protein [Nonomuraea soli]MBA2895507.1 endonuclease/exonuclease/phosphatase family metal-dependent hydrolase [Nonomuraea soli]
MRAAVRTFLATLFSLGLILTPSPAQADLPDAENWPRPRFISYNVCGSAKHCPPIYQGSKTAWRDVVVRAMDNWSADLVMLQEVCYGQWTLLRDHLQSRTDKPRYDSVWAAALPSAPGCSDWGTDHRFGLVIFAKGEAGTINNGSRTVDALPEVGNVEDRKLLCARSTVTGRTVRACNTHIDPDPASAKVQVERVATLTRAFAAQGEPVVLGGDFNVLPTDATLDPLYNHTGGHGVFQEVDENDKEHFGNTCGQEQDRCRTGEATAEPVCSPGVGVPGKIDYIFLSYYWFTTVRGDAAACTPGVSDHHLLRGAAAWEH